MGSYAFTAGHLLYKELSTRGCGVEAAEKLVLTRFQRSNIDRSLLAAGNYFLAMQLNTVELLDGGVSVFDDELYLSASWYFYLRGFKLMIANR